MTKVKVGDKVVYNNTDYEPDVMKGSVGLVDAGYPNGVGIDFGDGVERWAYSHEYTPYVEGKTLDELDVKAGDVVECVSGGVNCEVGGEYTVSDEKRVNGYKVGEFNISKFRIVSRAPQTPTLWRDMTDAEKGELLLAKHEGKAIEIWQGSEWKGMMTGGFGNVCAYRINPTPKVETMNIISQEQLSIIINTVSRLSKWRNCKADFAH